MAQHTLAGTARLGDRVVRRIGFGVMQLERRAPSRAAALELLTRAVEAGIDHFDTAEFYGHCNELIAQALGSQRDQLTLVTKVGAGRNGAGELVPAQKPAQLRAQVEANLRTLGTDRVDVVNLRRLDFAPGILAEGDQVVDLEDQLAELIALREAGKLGAIGLSNVSAEQVQIAQAAGVACVQNAYSLVDRQTEGVLTACREHDIAWVPYFPLGSAFPGRPKVVDDPTVIAVAAELGATPAQVGLAWLLASYDRTLLISGTADAAHLEQNIAAGDIRLSPDALAALNAVSG